MKNFIQARKEFVRRWPEANDEGRMSSRSLSIAFQTIGQLLGSPGAEIRVQDHYNTPESNRLLADTIIDLIQANDLVGFTFSKHKEIKIRYDLPYAAGGVPSGNGAARGKQRRAYTKRLQSPQNQAR